jgi:hypothetical protein
MVVLPGTCPDGSALDEAELTISHRYDIDNVDGEVVELAFADQPEYQADGDTHTPGATQASCKRGRPKKQGAPP